MIALVTGGASCGKSAYAEELCVQLGCRRVYLAAMRPFGSEGARRIAKHRAARAGKGFETIECYEDFAAIAHDARLEGATVLLECLGNVAANELFSDDDLADDSESSASAQGADSEDSSATATAAGDGTASDDFASDARIAALTDKIMAAIDAIAVTCANLIVVGNEVGGDGVTYERETRAYQELVGQLERALADRADLVAESVAGIPVVLYHNGEGFAPSVQPHASEKLSAQAQKL